MYENGGHFGLRVAWRLGERGMWHLLVRDAHPNQCKRGHWGNHHIPIDLQVPGLPSGRIYLPVETSKCTR
jgi:hypothetical protein